MKKRFSISLIIFGSILTFSCEEQSVHKKQSNLFENVISYPDTTTYKDGILIPRNSIVVDGASLREAKTADEMDKEEFAKLLAKSLKNKEFRSLIKDEANKKFDGDFDILYSDFKGKKLNSETIESIISKKHPNGESKGKEISKIAGKNQKLNISIPVHIEKWDESKEELLVAISFGAEENVTKQLKAFDSNGTEYLIDAINEPNVPVIVIGNNERMDYVPSSTVSSKNLRTNGNLEKITYIKCPDLGAIESWYFGGPELRFDGVIYSIGSATTYQAFTKTQHPSRDNAKDGYTLTQDLFNWYFENNHGPDYYIQSWEIDDSGTTYKLTVGVSVGKKDVVTGTAAFELSYKAQDKKLAGELIHYTSATPKTISDSFIQYKIEN